MSIRTNEGYIGMAVQTAKGTPAATSDIFFKYLEAGFPTEMDTTPYREGGDDEQIGLIVKNLHKEKFSIKILARPLITAYCYAFMMGKDTVTGTGDPYTHTITRLANSRKWFTIYRKLTTGVVVRYTDCKIETITAEAEAGKSWNLTIEGNALTAVILTAEEVPSYETGAPFVFYHSKDRYILDTVATSNIKKASVKISVMSQEGFQTDDILLGDLPDIKMEGEVTLELFAGTTANWKKANYNNGVAPAEGLYYSPFDFDNLFTENVADDRQFKMEIGSFQWKPVDLVHKGDPEVNTEGIAGIIVKPAAGEWAQITIKNSLSTDLA